MKLISTIATFCNSGFISKIIIAICLLMNSEKGFSQTGQALAFDGINDRVELPWVFNGSYTKEAWIKPTAATLATSSPNIISGDQTALFILAGQLTAGHAGASVFADVQDPALLVADTWYHIAVSYDATTGTMKLYKDGLLVDTEISVATFTETRQLLSTFFNTNFFSGQMDEVRFWSNVRSGTEILDNKDCPLSADEPNLVAYYNFNQGTAGGNNVGLTTLIDTQDKCT
ncbi:MAG TPA: LamG domain-containing protein, partial [Ferruginibacter sp.]|nr:LamG domain-containing protein [Ferruginibacter sp.]